MKRKTLRGKDVMLWIGNKVAALSTTCKLQLQGETEDGSTKDDGFWNSPEIVAMKWSASNESFDSADKGTTNDQVFDELFDLFIAGEPVQVTMGIPSNKSDDGVPEGGWTTPTPSAESPTYEGKAIITALDRDTPKKGNAKISISLEGVGALKKNKAA